MLRTKVRFPIVLLDLNNISVLFSDGGGDAGVVLGPCFPKILARTTFVLVSLPEAINPGQVAILSLKVVN